MSRRSSAFLRCSPRSEWTACSSLRAIITNRSIRDIFLTREDTHKKFERILEMAKHYRLTSTPMFLEFAAGKRDYSCSPWSTRDSDASWLEGALLSHWEASLRDVRGSSGTRWTGSTGSHARILYVRTARCTPASRRRWSVSLERTRRDLVRLAAWQVFG